MTLLTVIAEALLERRLLDDFRALGATGWTVTAAHGHGAGGDHDEDLIGGGNVRIEVLAPRPVVERALAHLQQAYFPHWGMIAFVHDVEVVRSDKFGG